jgi:serine/threonine-protein kinase RsbW
MDIEQTRTFPGQFGSLAAICKFVTRAAEVAGLDARAVYAVQMAVDEACTNIIEYAYGGEGRGDIECTCHTNSDGLTITLRDYGCPFDPDSVPEPNRACGIQECKVGGLGLYFMRQLMDEVRFEFTEDSGNVLTMVKRKETAS